VRSERATSAIPKVAENAEVATGGLCSVVTTRLVRTDLSAVEDRDVRPSRGSGNLADLLSLDERRRYYTCVERRRERQTTPASAVPSSSNDAGSGVGAASAGEKSNVNAKALLAVPDSGPM
jgi:hypothetical protein